MTAVKCAQCGHPSCGFCKQDAEGKPVHPVRRTYEARKGHKHLCFQCQLDNVLKAVQVLSSPEDDPPDEYLQ